MTTRKSHYTILGVPRGETDAGIRAAYLRLVKRLHPDHAGESGAPRFREVQHAYDVLSDPDQRRAYDDQLERKRPARRRRADPVARRPAAEPLVPEERIGRSRSVEHPAVVDDAFRWFLADATPLGGFDPRPRTDHDADVVVSPDLLRLGGDLAVAVPVAEPCPACSGTGIDWPFPCFACGQQGSVIGRRTVRLRVPPGCRPGTVIRLQPRHVGGVTLRVRLLVDPTLRAPPSR